MDSIRDWQHGIGDLGREQQENTGYSPQLRHQDLALEQFWKWTFLEDPTNRKRDW